MDIRQTFAAMEEECANSKAIGYSIGYKDGYKEAIEMMTEKFNKYGVFSYISFEYYRDITNELMEDLERF